jgi:hypothetical protein
MKTPRQKEYELFQHRLPNAPSVVKAGYFSSHKIFLVPVLLAVTAVLHIHDDVLYADSSLQYTAHPAPWNARFGHCFTMPGSLLIKPIEKPAYEI